MNVVRIYLLPFLVILVVLNLGSLMWLYRQHIELEHALEECFIAKQEYHDAMLVGRRRAMEAEVSEDIIDTVKKKIISSGSECMSTCWVNRSMNDLPKGCFDPGGNEKNNTELASWYFEPMGQDSRGTPAQRTRSADRTKAPSRRSLVKKRSGRSGARSRVDRPEPGEIEVRAVHDFMWPLTKGSYWKSTGFGPRKHPRGHWEFHHGIDLAAPRGTPVYAAASGVVTQARYAGGYGNTVVIAHSDVCTTRYAHLSKILVEVGQEIMQGDILGTVGATGNVRGKNGFHLHFEVALRGKRINPYYVLP